MDAKCLFDQTIAQVFAEELKGGLQKIYYEYVPERDQVIQGKHYKKPASVVATLIKEGNNNFILVYTIGVGQAQVLLPGNPLIKFTPTEKPDFFAKFNWKEFAKKVISFIPKENWGKITGYQDYEWSLNKVQVGKTLSEGKEKLTSSNSLLLLSPSDTFLQLHPSIYVNAQLQAIWYKPPQTK